MCAKFSIGIKKLEKRIIVDTDGNLMDYEYPTKEETMNKINEIIDYLDYQLKREIGR